MSERAAHGRQGAPGTDNLCQRIGSSGQSTVLKLLENKQIANTAQYYCTTTTLFMPKMSRMPKAAMAMTHQSAQDAGVMLAGWIRYVNLKTT